MTLFAITTSPVPLTPLHWLIGLGLIALWAVVFTIRKVRRRRRR